MRVQGFEHEALLYAGDDEFVELTSGFVREGLAQGEPVLVMVGARKIGLLREALGADAGAVRFGDMEEVGCNPARIIPAWRDFADEDADRPMRGVGEPIWAGRSSDELVECQTHESLLNLAFADAPAFRLLCPYDASALPPEVIDEARRSHPLVSDGEVRWTSVAYRANTATAGLEKPLGSPPDDARELGFGLESIGDVRSLVGAEAAAAGLEAERAADLVLAASEAAANSIRHGGGHGTLRIWRGERTLVCDIRDSGRIGDPLAGRVAPVPDGGRGIWLANHLCDLVQLRTHADGAVARLHMRLPE
ncbi:MAG TPA: anti-sigma factor RsbA family regulatory protein [Thermoleophilaceae bacterium]|nr:anti-sigma factor RsbA family regulatory protein [Thermoleophilaceae bacterium]